MSEMYQDKLLVFTVNGGLRQMDKPQDWKLFFGDELYILQISYKFGYKDG